MAHDLEALGGLGHRLRREQVQLFSSRPGHDSHNMSRYLDMSTTSMMRSGRDASSWGVPAFSHNRANYGVRSACPTAGAPLAVQIALY